MDVPVLVPVDVVGDRLVDDDFSNDAASISRRRARNLSGVLIFAGGEVLSVGATLRWKVAAVACPESIAERKEVGESRSIIDSGLGTCLKGPDIVPCGVSTGASTLVC